MQAERVCLSLTSSYAAHWGAWEGLRELVQNWHDGALAAAGERDEVRFAKLGEYTYEARGSGGAALGSARYDGATQTLALTNVGAVDRTALLLGFSRKAARRDVVGCFGEGLKVGALALLRLGAELRLETGREMWRFALEPDEAFGGQEVLVVHIKRFQYTAFSRQKVNTRIKFPVTGLDVSPHVSHLQGERAQ